jgi:predicted HTH transcriptional regulator
MTNEERIRACYQHACLQYVSNDRMTNSSLRKRFAIDERNYSIASRIIADTIKAKMIKLFDPESSSKKHASYVPIWA